MACSGDRDSDLLKIRQIYGAVYARYNWAVADIANAQTHWNLSQDHEAIEDIILALHDLATGIGYLTYKWDPFFPEYAIPHFLQYHTAEGGEVTMEAIIEAMWESDPLETFFFVNYIDGMRAAITNKRIEAEKLAEIYRHFLT